MRRVDLNLHVTRNVLCECETVHAMFRDRAGVFQHVAAAYEEGGFPPIGLYLSTNRPEDGAAVMVGFDALPEVLIESETIRRLFNVPFTVGPVFEEGCDRMIGIRLSEVPPEVPDEDCTEEADEEA